MNKTTVLIWAALLFSPQPFLYASGQHHPAGPGAQGGMASRDGAMEKMQQHLREMQRQMEAIRKTTDPARREKLMREHMQRMQEGMKIMRDLRGGMMKGEMGGGGAMMKKGMHGGDEKMGCGDPKAHQWMERRMEMMQMMMDQMMQHQQAGAPHKSHGKSQ